MGGLTASPATGLDGARCIVEVQPGRRIAGDHQSDQRIVADEADVGGEAVAHRPEVAFLGLLFSRAVRKPYHPWRLRITRRMVESPVGS